MEAFEKKASWQKTCLSPEKLHRLTLKSRRYDHERQ
jgi:hypothetical protein